MRSGLREEIRDVRPGTASDRGGLTTNVLPDGGQLRNYTAGLVTSSYPRHLASSFARCRHRDTYGHRVVRGRPCHTPREPRRIEEYTITLLSTWRGVPGLGHSSRVRARDGLNESIKGPSFKVCNIYPCSPDFQKTIKNCNLIEKCLFSVFIFLTYSGAYEKTIHKFFV